VMLKAGLKALGPPGPALIRPGPAWPFKGLERAQGRA
jgi:hypothetical protein